jgi:hypothetical protein
MIYNINNKFILRKKDKMIFNKYIEKAEKSRKKAEKKQKKSRKKAEKINRKFVCVLVGQKKLKFLDFSKVTFIL